MKRLIPILLLCSIAFSSCAYINQQEKSYDRPTKRALRKGRSVPFARYGPNKQRKTIERYEKALKKAPESEKGFIYFHYAEYLDHSYFFWEVNTTRPAAPELAFRYFLLADEMLPENCWQKYLTRYYLGHYYYHGKSGTIGIGNFAQAEKYFKLALDMDPDVKQDATLEGVDQLCEIYLGQIYEAGKDFDEAFVHYFKAALIDGKYINQGWLRLFNILYVNEQVAAGTFDQTAFDNFTAYYGRAEIGNGSLFDDRGLSYLDKAAELGYAPAQLEKGRIVSTRTIEEKQKWYRKAMERNFTPAVNELAWLNEMYSRDYSSTFSYCKQAAEAGFPPAQYGLGNLYKSGRGTDIDYQQAAAWYATAAENGYLPAKRALADLPDYIVRVRKAQKLQNVQNLLQGIEDATRKISAAMSQSGVRYSATAAPTDLAQAGEPVSDSRDAIFWQRDYDKYARIAKKEIIAYVESVVRDKSRDREFSLASDQRYRATEQLIRSMQQLMKNTRKSAEARGCPLEADAEKLALETEDFVSLLRRYRYR